MKISSDKENDGPLRRVLLKCYRFCADCAAMYWRRVLRSRYARKVESLKRDARRTRKIVFLLNETSKWKYQCVYDMLIKDPRFEVDVLLTFADVDWNMSRDEKARKLSENEAFFADKGMHVTVAYDLEHDRALPLCRFDPDIVFYQQPWHIAGNQSPKAVSRYALTLYAPYYLPTYVNPHGACDTTFHRGLFAHFVLNESLRSYFMSYCNGKFHSGEFVALGHPMVDYILRTVDDRPKCKCAIYAPHWSVPHPNIRKDNSYDLSTFLDYAEVVQKFALNHPEVKWIFKPHPSLYRYLVDGGIWEKGKVDSYYRKWEEIGEACYDGNYMPAFNASCVMITDCDSFLAEYAMTGKPIVHLVGIGVGSRKFSPYGALFETYYRVLDKQGLIPALDEYVLKGADPEKDTRLAALKESGLLNGGAAERIAKYVEKIAFGL